MVKSLREGIAIDDETGRTAKARRTEHVKANGPSSTRGRANWNLGETDFLPDVRDGLTRVERVILYELHKARSELGRENVPTGLLYGRVAERINIRPDQLQSILRRMGAAGD